MGRDVRRVYRVSDKSFFLPDSYSILPNLKIVKLVRLWCSLLFTCFVNVVLNTYHVTIHGIVVPRTMFGQHSQLVIYSHLHNTYTDIHVSIINIENLRRWVTNSSVSYFFFCIWNQSLKRQFKNNILLLQKKKKE